MCVWKWAKFYISAFFKIISFFPPPCPFPVSFSLVLLVSTICPPCIWKPNIIKGPFSQEHRPSLQTCGLMITIWSHYEDFIKDMKFLLDTHISDLKDQQRILLKYEYNTQCQTEFPENIVMTSEVWTWVTNCLDKHELHGAVTQCSSIHIVRGEKVDASHPSWCLQTATPGIASAHHQTQGAPCSTHHQNTWAQRLQLYGHAT